MRGGMNMLYENGVDKLLSLSRNISELYRELMK